MSMTEENPTLAKLAVLWWREGKRSRPRCIPRRATKGLDANLAPVMLASAKSEWLDSRGVSTIGTFTTPIALALHLAPGRE